MSEVILYEGTAPITPPAGGITIYAKIDKRLYWKDDAGTETPFYPTGAGTGDLLSDGTVPLVANWDVGAYEITMLRGHFDTATGQPFTVVSTDKVVNLNADLLDGFTAADFQPAGSYLAASDIGSTVQAWSAVLDATTASFLIADETKLDNIEALADVTDATNVIASLNGATITGATVAATDEVLIQDVDDADNLKTVTADSIAQLAPGYSFDGTQYVGVNDQTGTTYELVLGDAGKLITMTNGAANTLTIPANSSVAFAVGTRIDVLQLGAGQTTVAITTDTLNASGGTKINAQYEVVSLLKIAATTWVLVGGVA